MEGLNWLRLISALLILELLSLSNGKESSVKPSCPIEITPDPVVVQYRDKAKSVKCKPTSNISTNVQELYWKGVGEPTRPRSADWLPDTQNDWDLSPVCIGKFAGNKICEKPLNFILYKTPDSVSISHVTSKSSSVEDEECQLQCNITQVAPARRLIVRWYHGNETIKTVTGCQPENNINCNESRKPVNVLSTINVTLNRKYNEAVFRCEVELDLKPEGPQISYTKSNNQVNITVYYKPVINYTKLPKAIPVFSGYPEQLICEADGNPPPKIQWFKGPDMPLPDPGGVLNVSKPGVYICNATNKVGSASYKVDVILKEDYLPLIAGFVAVTVVIISVIFLFIYSIYYKNTKMRRYSLKNPKLSNHNGNVAHNGWDLQFPMTKLS